MKICLCQLNPTVGDLRGNVKKTLSTVNDAYKGGANLIVYPEMFLSGYQLQDLVFKEAFLCDVDKSLKHISQNIPEGVAVLIGAPKQSHGKIYNSYFLIRLGSITLSAQKFHLPNKDIFDEERYFAKGEMGKIIKVEEKTVGTPICEDIWYPDVVQHMVTFGANIIISPNGSPYSRGKVELREKIVVERASENKIPMIYLNLVGGQDDQVFDGGSFAVDQFGQKVLSLPQFEECVHMVKFEDGIISSLDASSTNLGKFDENHQDYRAMCLALQDYVRKSDFSKVLIGLSGGIDSALVATIAVDALGSENVLCVRLPSIFTSKESLNDAEILSKALKCKLDTVSITDINDQILKTLNPLFSDKSVDVVEENIQARIRGLLLMAISNKTNSMLLTTGNKSEVAVGYSTIYGDMAGGYNPIKDLYKTRVFKISHWRNLNYFDWMLGPSGKVIPEEIIRKPPSAELRPNQTDQDSLPPYEILDKILEGLIENDLSVEDLEKRGFDNEIVKMVEALIYGSEYKRYQAAPGVHLTDRSFWLGRRYPIVQKWRDKK